MKRQSFFGIMSILPLCVCAQTMIKETDGADTRFIPGAYMKDGKAAIYFSENEYGYDDGQTNYEATIFDFDLNPLKSFPFQALHPYTVTEKREVSGTKELTRVIDEFRGYFGPEPSIADMEHRKEAFILWFYEENKYFDPTLSIELLTANCRIEDSTILISIPIDAYEYVRFPEYLKSRQIYLSADDKWGVRFNYATTVPVCDGPWTKATWYDVPISNFCTPRCTDVSNLNDWNGGVYLPFSQTFFNNDEKFEYVRYTAEIAEGGHTNIIDSASEGDPLQFLFGVTASDRDGDGEVDYKQTRYGVNRTGLEVVSEDGTIVYSFPLPNKAGNNAHVEFYKSDNNILVQIDFDWYDESNNYKHSVRFYRIDKMSGIPQIIREETTLTASPNPASSGTPIELTLSESENMRSISVFTLNGEKVYSVKIEKGVNRVSIPTAGLSQGLYVFAIHENGIKTDAVKIIIR